MNSEIEAPRRCAECGASWINGQTCEDHFHQLLYWEAENPAYRAEVHHLMVLCYYVQHPSLYSPEGLNEARRLLAEFVEHDLSPVEARQRNRAHVDSNRRNWKIKGTAASHGSYAHAMVWKITASDVVAGGSENYCDNVRGWAESVNAVLKTMP
jgi:hypothetical protein